MIPSVSFRLPSSELLYFVSSFAIVSGFLPRSLEGQSPDHQPSVIHVTSRASLVHLGSLDSFDATQMGKVAARKIVEFLDSKNTATAQEVIDIYDRIIPDENFGGEYTALRWLLKCELASEVDRKQKYLNDPHVEGFYSVLSEKNWENLRGFLNEKYHLEGKEVDRYDFVTAKRKNRFLEDFILFNNPVRDSWEKSNKMIEMLKIQPGQKIADIGSGPGYFSFKFAKLVGDSGMVYAVETSVDHLSYLKQVTKKLKIRNVMPLMPSVDDLGFEEKVDLVYMCSLYHNMYAMFSNQERESMISSIKRVMKPDARFVLADNGPVLGTLPYHGPFISRELVIEQFKHFGFDLVETHQFIPQRYCLIFKLTPGILSDSKSVKDIPIVPVPDEGTIVTELKKLPPTPGVCELVDGSPENIRILSQISLVRTLIRGVSPMFSHQGREAAQQFYDALESMEPVKLKACRDVYASLKGAERLGDEYSAFLWFIDRLLAPDSERAKFITDDLVKSYFDFFAGENYKRLKLYLKNKYVVGDLRAKMDEVFAKQKSELEKDILNESESKPETSTAETTPSKNSKATVHQDKERNTISPESSKGSTAPSNDPKKMPAPPPRPNLGQPSDGIAKDGESKPAKPNRELPAHIGEGKKSSSEKEFDFPLPPYESLPLDIDLKTIGAWWEYMVYSDPNREKWEQSQKVIDLLKLKEGDTVADIGSGAGFYTFKFAKKVGNSGKVFALELVDEQLTTLKESAKKAGFNNIETVLSKENDAMLPPNSIDVAYLCSIYHETYVSSMEYVRDQFVHSLVKALKPGGRLVIVDNQPRPTKAGAYYGPHIAKELIIAQLMQYGFRFSAYAQFIPQRYVLVFESPK